MTRPAEQPAAKPRRRKRKWVLRVMLLVLLLAVAVPLGVVWWYTRPAQLLPVIEQALYDATGCEAAVTHAKVNRKGEVVLQGVTLRVPGAAGDFGTLFTAQRIEMVGEPRGLIDGSYRPTRIEIIEPVLHLTEQAETGTFNFELLTAPQGADEAPIPRVVITDGRIRFDRLNNDGLTTLGEMGVAGELEPDTGAPKAYRFSIAETDAPDGIVGVAFTGGFDLDQPSVDLRAEHFRFEDELRYFIPADFRRWWARLAPTGRIPELTLALRPDEYGALGLHAVQLAFTDVGFNLNVLDAKDPDQRDIALLLRMIKTRLTQISGTATIEAGRFEIIGNGTSQFTGVGLSPIAYEVVATGGLRATDAFDVRLQTRPFSLSDRYQFPLAFSPLTGMGYRRFRPSGDFALSAVFSAPAGDAPADWAVDLDILDGRMTHAMFPLPLENVRGKVHITEAVVDIGPITARSVSGAGVTLAGYAKPASDAAEVKLDIAITRLPVDQTLRNALEPNARENMKRFFDARAYAGLLGRGLIARPDADAASAPRFALGGKVDVDVPVYRPYGEDEDYSVVPVVRPKGLRALMADFPYPVMVDSGTIRIGPDFVEINNLGLAGLTGGGLTISGSARKGADGEYRPQLLIHEAALPIDPLLLSAIGPEADELLTDLGVTGVVEAQGRVFQRPQDTEPDLALDVAVTQASATPYAGRVTVNDVTGSLHLRAQGLDDLRISGQYGDTAVHIAGDVDWSRDDSTTADLTFDVRGMRWSPELLDVLPPDSELRAQLAPLYADYEPAGTFDAVLNWQPNPGDEPDGFDALVTPNDLALNLLGGRMRYTDMAGSVTVYTDLMQLNDLAGSFNDDDGASGRLSASGEIGFEDASRIGLSFTGNTSAIGHTARLMLPGGALSVIDAIQYDGPLSVGEAELTMTAVGDAAQATGFTGGFALPGVTMVVGGLPIEDFDGTLEVQVISPPGDAPTRMAYALAAESFRANDRRIDRFRITADNHADPSVLRTGRGTGSIYGGTAVLEASIDLSSQGGARLSASLHDVELAPLLKPEEADGIARARVVDRTLESGLLSASLLLDASYDGEGPRYGRGSIRLRDAGLLAETPLELWLIQALNLNFPDQRGFDRGGAEFDVDGDRVVFDTLWLDTVGRKLTLVGVPVFEQGLRIAGNGTMTYPDMALDLRLRTEITGSSETLPFYELLRLVRNELVGLEVGGTLKEPEITYRVLRDTRGAWEELVKPVAE